MICANLNPPSLQLNCIRRPERLIVLPMKTLIRKPTVGELLTSEDMEALRRYPSPTIANAIETFQVRPRLEGVTDSRIRCLFPGLGPVVGYACTAIIISSEPAPHPRKVSRRDYWEYLRSFPGPRLSVVQDLSPGAGRRVLGGSQLQPAQSPREAKGSSPMARCAISTR